jgi:hypothetical protein
MQAARKPDSVLDGHSPCTALNTSEIVQLDAEDKYSCVDATNCMTIGILFRKAGS